MLKVKQLKTLNVVKPAWIVESVAAGTLLDYRKYLLYSNQSKSQPCLQFQKQGNQFDNGVNDNNGSKISSGNSLRCITDSTEKSENNVTFKLNTNSANNRDTCEFQSESIKNEKNIESSRNTITAELNTDKNKATVKASAVSPIKEKSSCGPRRTAVEPEFLSEFYGNSRLHHLSTMGAVFKEYVARLRANSQKDFPGLKRLMEWKKKNCYLNDLRGDDYVDELFDEPLGTRGSRKEVSHLKTIMHIDMDCFFVSVGLRARPELKGQPVAVTHAKVNSSHFREGANRQFERDFYKQRFENRIKQKQVTLTINEEVERKSRLSDVGENDSLSEIASCNYEARKAGVKNGMFFGTAIKLCPNLKTIPYDFEGYKEVSYKLYDTLARYTLDIEAVSCDEMYVDCTEVLKKAGVSSLEFATFLRGEIKDITGCTASAGFGSNPLQARLATKKAKPNGQFHLLPSEVERFMQNIKVEDLPGVGHSLSYKLHSVGIKTCGDLQRLSKSALQQKFGAKTGEALHLHARGEDNRSLDVCHQRKSVSAEVNYGIRFTSQTEAEAFLHQLAEEVVVRMKQARVKGRLITLKLMIRAKDAPVETAKYMGHGACDNVSRSTSLVSPTDDVNIIFKEAVALERQLKVLPSDLRGVGIQLSRLHNAGAPLSKNNLLTNFLGLNKNNGQKHQEDTAQKSAKNELIQNKNEQSSKSCSSTLDTEQIVDDFKNAKEEQSLPSIKNCREEENKIGEKVSTSKSDVQKKLTICSDKKASDKLKEADALLVLTPSIEVPKMSLLQARKLIRAWVMSEAKPQNCDVVMFASFIQRLITERHLEDVDVLYNMLHRLLINKGKVWKAAYRRIVDSTQIVMQAVYGADLKVPTFE